MVALIQSKNYAANKGKMAGSYQFDTQPTGIGLKGVQVQTSKRFGYNRSINRLNNLFTFTFQNLSQITCQRHFQSLQEMKMNETCLLNHLKH